MKKLIIKKVGNRVTARENGRLITSVKYDKNKGMKFYKEVFKNNKTFDKDMILKVDKTKTNVYVYDTEYKNNQDFKVRKGSQYVITAYKKDKRGKLKQIVSISSKRIGRDTNGKPYTFLQAKKDTEEKFKRSLIDSYGGKYESDNYDKIYNKLSKKEKIVVYRGTRKYVPK
jgi:hypothetical protein